MADFTLVQLRYFVGAAELGGMTAAARELMVAQSAISSAIANLEREVGVQLFLRHHAKGLSLTPAGARFLTEARDFLAHAARLAESAQDLGAALTGDLEVGCFVTLAPFVVPRLLASFAEHHPAVRVVLTEGELPGLHRALLDRRIEGARPRPYGSVPPVMSPSAPWSRRARATRSSTSGRTLTRPTAAVASWRCRSATTCPR